MCTFMILGRWYINDDKRLISHNNDDLLVAPPRLLGGGVNVRAVLIAPRSNILFYAHLNIFSLECINQENKVHCHWICVEGICVAVV